jgi:hypothetical protein
MKTSKMILSLAASLFASNALASGAVSYTCVGKNAPDRESVVFELLFADHGRGVGYTNQSVTITQKGGMNLPQPIVLQMYGANSKNHCKKNKQGEIYLGTDLNMTPTPEGSNAAYTVTVQADCGAPSEKLDIKADCFFDN